MEKILLAMDSRKLNVNTVNFACYLTRLTKSKLTGIFLENLIVQEKVLISQSEVGISITDAISINGWSKEDERIKEEHMRLFLDIAEQEGIQATIDVEKGIPVTDIINKTRYADLLVIDARTFSSGVYESIPTRFVKDILQEAECPVIIAPDNFSSISNIVFCFHGSKSSLFAIKQFSYLFPELRDKRAKVIYLNPEQKTTAAEEQLITDWLKYHYNDVETVQLEGDAIDAFFNYLLKKKNDFVVMGAYGRGLLHSFFEHESSFQHGTTSLPVFIAHY